MAEIDTSIYQNQQRQPDLMESMGKMLAMKSMLQQQATNAQAQQMGALQLEQHKRDMADQELVRQAYMEVGGDYGKLIPLAASRGASPKILMSLRTADIDMRGKIAKLSEDEAKVEGERNNRALGLIKQTQDMPPGEFAAAWPQIAAAMKAIHPNSPLDPNQPLTQEQFGHLGIGIQNYDTVLKGKKSEQETKTWQDKQALLPTETAEAKAKAAKAQTEALQAGLALVGQTVPDTNQGDWTAFRDAQSPELQKFIPTVYSPNAAKVVQNLGMTVPQRKAAETAEFNAKNNVSEVELIRRSQMGGEEGAIATRALAKLIEVKRATSPTFNMMSNRGGPPSPTAKGIASGTLSPATYHATLRRNPFLTDEILAVDPDFDEANLDTRYQTLKEFNNTSAGKAGGMTLALNTLIHHANLYLDIAQSVKNNSFRPGNQAYNTVATMMGKAPPNNLNLIAQFLAGEGGKVATGGVPAQSEIHSLMDRLAGANSPEQFKDAGNLLIQIGGGRMVPLLERAKQAKITKVFHVLDPESEAILRSRGFDPETMKPAASTGSSGGGWDGPNPFKKP